MSGNMVGLCDIDDLHLEKKGHAFKSARKFNDYREMLDVMGDKIDAVTVSTPDHSHAPASHPRHEERASTSTRRSR